MSDTAHSGIRNTDDGNSTSDAGSDDAASGDSAGRNLELQHTS